MSEPRKRATVSAQPTDNRVQTLLDRIPEENLHLLQLKTGATLFTQGDHADHLFFVQRGEVKITVVSTAGKEAVIAILGPDSFVGEGALVGHSLRVSTATVLEPSRILRIQTAAMAQALREFPKLSEKFIAALLARNVDLEEDLCDQLFNHSEKRLARVLLKLARLRDHSDIPDTKIPQLTHETLAEMVGTTRSRVTQFMNKFRSMGLIDYNGELMVRTELLTDLVLHD